MERTEPNLSTLDRLFERTVPFQRTANLSLMLTTLLYPKGGRQHTDCTFLIPSVLICNKAFIYLPRCQCFILIDALFIFIFKEQMDSLWCFFPSITDPLGCADVETWSNWLSRGYHQIVVLRPESSLSSRALTCVHPKVLMTQWCVCVWNQVEPRWDTVWSHWAPKSTN